MSTAHRNRQQGMKQQGTTMASMWEDASAKPRELVREYPISSTMVAFGLGLGVGLLIGQTVVEAMSSKSATQSKIDEYGAYGRHLVDSVRSTVSEALERYLPHR